MHLFLGASLTALKGTSFSVDRHSFVLSQTRPAGVTLAFRSLPLGSSDPSTHPEGHGEIKGACPTLSPGSRVAPSTWLSKAQTQCCHSCQWSGMESAFRARTRKATIKRQAMWELEDDRIALPLQNTSLLPPYRDLHHLKTGHKKHSVKNCINLREFGCAWSRRGGGCNEMAAKYSFPCSLMRQLFPSLPCHNVALLLKDPAGSDHLSPVEASKTLLGKS